MPLPDFHAAGDLPPGVHRATLDEVVRHFGATGGQRGVWTRCLVRVHELARRTGWLQRFVVFGSYVTAELEPNDVDVVLMMDDAFCLEECPIEAQGLFDHAVAQARYAASIFWMRPKLLGSEETEDFLSHWQVKRDGTKRGIVEVVRPE